MTPHQVDRRSGDPASARRRAVTTWVFTRHSESVRLARVGSDAPQLVIIGPGCRREIRVGRTEDDLGMLQLALERRLQRHGWSYEGCEVA